MEDDVEVLEAPTTCPMCSGEGRLLGALSCMVWRTCRHCGAEWNDTGTIHEEASR